MNRRDYDTMEMAYTSQQLQEGNVKADNILFSARENIHHLRTQNDTIGGSEHRLQEVGMALGLSRTTMRSIERHISRDRLLVIGAIAGILFLFFLLWWLL